MQRKMKKVVLHNVQRTPDLHTPFSLTAFLFFLHLAFAFLQLQVLDWMEN